MKSARPGTHRKQETPDAPRNSRRTIFKSCNTGSSAASFFKSRRPRTHRKERTPRTVSPLRAFPGTASMSRHLKTFPTEMEARGFWATEQDQPVHFCFMRKGRSQTEVNCTWISILTTARLSRMTGLLADFKLSGHPQRQKTQKKKWD